MNDEEYIKRAVDLTDGFEVRTLEDGQIYYHWPCGIEFPGQESQQFKDVLVAQLVRQLCAENLDACIPYARDSLITIKAIVNDT